MRKIFLALSSVLSFCVHNCLFFFSFIQKHSKQPDNTENHSKSRHTYVFLLRSICFPLHSQAFSTSDAVIPLFCLRSCVPGSGSISITFSLDATLPVIAKGENPGSFCCEIQIFVIFPEQSGWKLIPFLVIIPVQAD